MRFSAIIIATLASSAAASEIVVPSGRSLTLFDVIMEADLARFRFVLPAIADGVTFSDLVDDLQYICDAVAIPALKQAQSDVSQMVVSVSAQEVPFGEASDIAQFFQPFRVADNTCIWEEF